MGQRSSQAAETSFSTEVDKAVEHLRTALVEALAAAGLDATVPFQVSKALHADKNLCWKICKIVTEPEPVLVASRLPGKPGMKIIAKALRKAGAGDEVVSAVEQAVERFRKLEVQHAGDRATMTAMLTGTSRSGREQEEFERRRSFLGHSATWGIKARVQLNTQIISPSAVEGMIDLAQAAGFLGFQRLNNGLPWSLVNLTLLYDQGRPVPVDIAAPVDPDGVMVDGVPLVREFCTTPLPSMRLMKLSGGVTRLLVGERPLGRAGAFDVIAAFVMRGKLPMFGTEDDRLGCHVTQLYTPVELLINDFFVHRSLMFAMNPRLAIHSQLASGPMFPADGMDAGIMRVGCSLELLGSPPDLTTPEFPQFPALAHQMVGALGHDIEDFVGYRLRLKYPPLPALVALKYELPARP
jgi:hypothetical protein